MKMGRPRAAPLCEVKVPDEEFPEFAPHYTTRSDVELVTGDCIRTRYQLGLRSVLASEPFLTDIGHLGEGPAVAQILHGTYIFPPNTPPEIEALFHEAAALYDKTKDMDFSPYITIEEFQYWWRHCRLDTQSSFSNIHYDHYGCAAYDDNLSALQVAKLNAAIRLGWPLKRWLHTVIVLLQKEMGTVFVNKLQAICLFEADFNYVLKVIFAQRMMGNLNRANLLPPEQHAKAFSGAKNATMNRLLWQDIHRTLHWPYATALVDLGDCYDAMYHGWNVVSLLAAGVPNCHVKLMLIALQTMGWHLKTGFGLAETSFRGSEDEPMMGMGQGSSAAAPAFSVTSLLQTNAYRRRGHCEPVFSAWSGLLLILAAIIYVDDTDLLLRAKRRQLSDTEFFNQIQAAINCWGHIVMATGGHLKQAKCKVSVVSFGYKNGASYIKTMQALPATPFVVPQHVGPPLIIETIPPDKSCEALGSFIAADGNPNQQVEEMRQKGLAWVDRLSSSHLTPIDGILSLKIHLKPRLCWNNVTFCASPSIIEKQLSKVFFKALPHLRVNRYIRSEFRHLPYKYQGLGIFDVNIERLGMKLFWIQRYWGSGCLEGQMLFHAYEAFSIDLGLDGNPFTYSFTKYGHLTVASWWKDLWELLCHFDIRLELDSALPFQPYRLGDKSIMRWFAESNFFTTKQLSILNRVRKRKCVFFLSELVLCDGRTVDISLLDGSEGSSRNKTYPMEKPTSSDVSLWMNAIRSLSSASYHLPTSLGAVLCISPDIDWFWNEQGRHLVKYNRAPSGDIRAYDHYIEVSTTHNTRNTRYQWEYSSLQRPPLLSHLASVRTSIVDENHVRLHSITSIPASPTPPINIRAVLHSWGNNSLWRDLQLHGDGTWLIEGLIQGTIEGAADGSFMVEVCPDVCSAAFMLICTVSKRRIMGTWSERSQFAGNYRGEIFGGMALALVLRAAATFLPDASQVPQVKLWFDNSGVIHHGNKPNADLLERQTQADVLSLLKRYLRELSIPVSFEKVEAHVDDYRPIETFSPQETWNMDMDRAAKFAILNALETNSFISPIFPFETFRFHNGFGKISGSPIAAIYDWHGYITAKQLFDSKGIVSTGHFDLIYWEGMEKAVSKFPDTFKFWISKHVSHFCGTNRFLSKIDPSVKNICPSCGQPDESTSHITRCSDPGRIASLEAAIDDLSDWMDENDTDPILQHLIEEYLLGRGVLQMADIIEAEQEYIDFATIHDDLGWDNFVEGRISKSLVHLQTQYLSTIHTYVKSSSWASGLIRQLLILTHQQWLYRNCTVHYKTDGRSLPQHKEILQKVTALLHTDEDMLLPEDQDLLHIDFAQLGKGPTIDQERWIASMNSALSAGRIHRARHGRRIRLPRLRRRLRSHHHSQQPSDLSLSSSESSTEDDEVNQPAPPLPPLQSRPHISRSYIPHYFAPIPDTEGSLRYKRRRRK